MADAAAHRGAPSEPVLFARRFVEGRLSGFAKDMRICLTATKLESSAKLTHAYFPALAACCGLLEYLAALFRGNVRGIGWTHIADWAERYLPQPDYDRDTIRVLFDCFRHSVAHRGIASGVWLDRAPPGSRRITWKVHASAGRPACRLLHQPGTLTKDPPWPCHYTHRMHIHLRSLQKDISGGALAYVASLESRPELQGNFNTCMRQLYPV